MSNSFYDLIKSRESIREYDPNKKVKENVIKRILEAGAIAPSAVNKQPWKFILVSTEDMLNRVKECYHREWFKNVQHVLAVVGNKENSWIREADNYNSIETDLAIAMDHIILAAESEGVATCWIGAFDPDKLNKVLSIKENEVVYCITPLGYTPDGFTKKVEKKRRDLKDTVIYL